MKALSSQGTVRLKEPTKDTALMITFYKTNRSSLHPSCSADSNLDMSKILLNADTTWASFRTRQNKAKQKAKYSTDFILHSKHVTHVRVFS
ncbi:hypothetical protein CHS0354_018939 [Potamilus streckersoni]|uniref:Uncharacterized protein n=1 Tax=Potamilus streckersoni TaxID=2493646 RepID=A0AAE0T6L9_9BIVA|nr:hypothetical protein CHS0354_018939 [Potamilus streckersoni]